MNPDDITGDLLIADYTEYRKEHPTETLPSGGVAFLERPDSRLGSFCILNPRHLPFEAINLEENPQLVTGSDGKLVKQCECICRALREKGKRWVLLLELKYCKADNIPANMRNALEKLVKCHDFLNVEKHFFDGNPCRIYLCASHPEHEAAEPFGNFINNQDKLLGLNEKGLKFLYCNAVSVLTPEYLKAAYTPRKYRLAKR